ncbi:uncharacterized protein EV420DRAFT_406711 [Desarmillaria tabescens]|uniref:Uncharacterized protein n=1 Tax=Armillaria tabescens TaxID=1929756 RepID=A0AA39KBG9_ARMTA|nr:uncharacterized protein EV420DRAFT_406711 [Desarmillaria tabescens]KAK0458020.1 hypothetical protein EV420DRAFT_406711 [Desarmillaria tabescens]
MACAAEKVRLMTGVEGLLNTGIYHLEKSIQKTVIFTVDSVRDLFERKCDGDPTFSQLRLRSNPSKPVLDTSSLEYALVAFALLFGAGDAREEHQARSHLTRKFMEAKNHAMPKINGLLLHLLTRWLCFLDFSRKTGFARVNLDMITRLPHDQPIRNLDEKNRLLQKTVDNVPLECIIPTLGSLKDYATFTKAWDTLDIAARQSGRGYRQVEDILDIDPCVQRASSHSCQRRTAKADKNSSPLAGKRYDGSVKSDIKISVQPSPPSPLDSNISEVSLSGGIRSCEHDDDEEATATTRTNVADVDSNEDVASRLVCSDKVTHHPETHEASPESSVEEFTDDEYDDSFPGLFVGGISFAEPLTSPSTRRQQKSATKSKQPASTSEPEPRWTYPICQAQNSHHFQTYPRLEGSRHFEIQGFRTGALIDVYFFVGHLLRFLRPWLNLIS